MKVFVYEWFKSKKCLMVMFMYKYYYIELFRDVNSEKNTALQVERKQAG